MTKDEIIGRLSTDYNFALEFAVDNNLPGVLQVLSVNGYKGGTSRSWALSTLTGLFKSGDVEKIKTMLNSVRYMNNVDNYTGGLADFFMRNTPPNLYPTSNPQYRLEWNGFLSALGIGLSTYAAATAPAAATANATVLAAQQAEKDRLEAEKKEKDKKTYLTIGIIAGSLLLIAGLWLAFKPKKKAD